MRIFKSIFKQFFSGSFIFVGALMATNVLNFAFNAILGRVLTLEQFSIITLVNTLWLLITIWLNSLASTTNNRVAYLSAKRGENVAQGFRSFVTKKSLLLSGILTILWIALVPIFLNVFHTNDVFLFLSIAPAITFGVYAAVTRGFFQGTISFIKAAIIILAESVSKVVFALVFIYFNQAQLAYLSIPLSLFLAFIVALLLIFKSPKILSSYTYIFPQKLLFATFLTAFSSMAFLTIDLLLARHFLSARDSGAYSLLSLVGKMIFFLGTLLNVFILTYASRDTGLNKNSAINFYKILGLNIGLLGIGFITLGIFGNLVVPILFGQKSLAIIPYLFHYSLAMIFFSLASSFATYHLAKQQFIFAYNGVLSTVMAGVLLYLFHGRIDTFVFVLLLVSFYYLASNVVLHILYKDNSEYVDDEDKRKIANFDKVKEKALSVSICLPAFNEGKNIGKLLLALLQQETTLININKIFVVSSASTDDTNKIVSKIVKQYPKQVVFIEEEKRTGKASAINTFLKKCKDTVVVIQSADTIPMKDTIEKLCRPFLIDENIGMTGGAPIPVNDPNTFLGFVIHTWWWFHRNIPRFGEIIAFRNILSEVSPRTAVDEAFIQAKFAQLGYKIVHVDEAKIYNKGSENIRDIIKQRRRIFNGHTRLEQEENVHISAMTKSGIKLLLFEYKMYGFTQLIWLTGGILIELWANMLGRYDKYVNKVNPVVWDIAKSTKNLRMGIKGGSSKR